MAQQVTNFGRFYCALRQLSVHGDAEETKRDLVMQYTSGRTGSLREMTMKEYGELCAGMERMGGTREELRKRRSEVLALMQGLGVDTTDWGRVDSFCRDPRIAGKRFCRLGIEELKETAVRLRAMKRKGYRGEARKGTVVVNILPVTGSGLN